MRRRRTARCYIMPIVARECVDGSGRRSGRASTAARSSSQITPGSTVAVRAARPDAVEVPRGVDDEAVADRVTRHQYTAAPHDQPMSWACRIASRISSMSAGSATAAGIRRKIDASEPVRGLYVGAVSHLHCAWWCSTPQFGSPGTPSAGRGRRRCAAPRGDPCAGVQDRVAVVSFHCTSGAATAARSATSLSTCLLCLRTQCTCTVAPGGA